jgi:hypothetical protein
VSLLAQLLAACYFRLHPEEKTEPEQIDWSLFQPGQIERTEAARKARRGKHGGKASRAKRAAAQQRFRDRQRARLGEEKFLEANAAAAVVYRRSEAGQRNAAHHSDQKFLDSQRAARRGKRLAAALATIGLADLEAPSYVVIDVHGRRIIEAWPLRDEAAAWLALAECRKDTTRGVQKPLDTNAESA